jgi:hypothetical protein
MIRASMIVALAVNAAAFCLPAAAADVKEPPVAVYTSGLQPALAEKIEKHAAEGMTSLSRYLNRTRKEHGLTVEDVTRPPEVRTATDPDKAYKKHATDWKQPKS